MNAKLKIMIIILWTVVGLLAVNLGHSIMQLNEIKSQVEMLKGKQ